MRGSGRRALLVALALAVASSACSAIVTLEPPTLDEVPRQLPVQSVVLAADGSELAVLRYEHREPIRLSALPDHLVRAVLAAEDHRFFQHGGIDARALGRAAAHNVATGEVEQGGSTITQQLVKNLYMPDAPRTPETKLREALLARRLEEDHSKAEILEDYLNTVYFGRGAYGVQAAAHAWFGTTVDQLEPAQSALLAALIRAPGAIEGQEVNGIVAQRRNLLLEQMAAQGLLDEAVATAARAAPPVVAPMPAPPDASDPHLVDLVVRTLLDDPSFGPDRQARAQRLFGGGLRVHTTVRPDLQELAREVLRDHLGAEDEPDTALAAVDPATGAVLAVASNRDYDDLVFDLATQARRQPGSTFKTFVLAAAIAEGWHPEDTVDGRQGEIDSGHGGWNVRNYDRRSYPNVTLVGAARASVNAAFARLGLAVGIERVAGLAAAMGVASPIPEDAQITIGGGALGVTPLDMAAGYATLANLGEHAPTVVVSHIEDADGEVVWRPDRTPRAVLPPSAAFVTTDVLREVVEQGTGRAAQVPGWEVAGKTGTTSEHTDAWFAGYTATLSTAVWVGHHEGSVPLQNVRGVARVTGGTIPARIFSDFMTAALADTEPVAFELPDEHWDAVEIDPRTGLRATSWCPGDLQRLPKVLVPRDTCPSPPPAPPPPPPAPSPTATATATATPSPTPSAPSPTPSPPASPAEPSPSVSPSAGPSATSED